jgi:phage gp36-like protein
MAYCTQSDMEARYGTAEVLQLTDRLNTGEVDTEVLDLAIADATAEIDAYLAGRYALPLTSVPVVLTRLCGDIARYRLWENGATDEVRDRYRDAVRLLEQIAKGTVTLGIAPAPEAPAGGGVSHFSPDRLMTRDTLENF